MPLSSQSQSPVSAFVGIAHWPVHHLDAISCILRSASDLVIWALGRSDLVVLGCLSGYRKADLFIGRQRGLLVLDSCFIPHPPSLELKPVCVWGFCGLQLSDKRQSRVILRAYIAAD